MVTLCRALGRADELWSKLAASGRDLDETLTAQHGYALVGVVRVPGGAGQSDTGYLATSRDRPAHLGGRGGDRVPRSGRIPDVRGVPLSFIDCVYFATISLTTVGYGDSPRTTNSPG